MAKTRRRRPGTSRRPRKSCHSGKPRKPRQRRRQRGGAATANDYADAWERYIANGTVPALSLADQATFNLWNVNAWQHNPAHPERNLATFVQAAMTEAPEDQPADPAARAALMALAHAQANPAAPAVTQAQRDAIKRYQARKAQTWRTIRLPHNGIPANGPDGAPVLGPLLYTISERTPYMARFELVNCPELTDDHIAQLYYGGAGNIDEMDFQGCTGLTHQASEVFRGFQPTHLNLNNIPNVNDAWIENITTEPPGEEADNGPIAPWHLTLDSAPGRSNGLTDSGVADLAAAAPNYLQHLSIRRNTHITFAAVEALRQAFAHAHQQALAAGEGNPRGLDFLDLTGCPAIRAYLLANPGNPFAFMGLIQDPAGPGIARWAPPAWFAQQAAQRARRRGA